MKTAEEILRTKLIFNRKEDLWVGEVLAAMEEYAMEYHTEQLNKPCVSILLPKAGEIEQEIHNHLNSLPYNGGYPYDWEKTLSKHIRTWLRKLTVTHVNS